MVELVLQSLGIASGGKMLVGQANLSIRTGECVGLVGASGSGKTLTLRALLGLLDPRLSVHGVLDVQADGQRLQPFRDGSFPAIRGGTVGYLPQDGRAALDPLQRVGAQVSAVAALRGDPDPRPWLAHAGFSDPTAVLRHWPHELSGGMAQRVALAQALARGSRILLADEPTTGLDARIAREILAGLRRRVDAGLGLVLVTHDVRALAGIADRIVFMDRGETVEEVAAERFAAGQVQTPVARHLLEASRRSPSPLQPDDGLGPPVWRLERIVKGWRRWPWSAPVAAVRHVDLDVAPGARLAVVGESGCGKTTLVRAGLGLVARDGGAVSLFGERTEAWRPRQWRHARRRAQLLVQDPRAMLHPRFPLGLLLEESARLHQPGEDPVQAADRVLAQVGLSDLRHARCATLSGGERRRAGIARILIARPGLVVADEPTSGLDASLKADTIALLDRALGPECALVVITHDLASITHFARQTVVMSEGRITEVLPRGAPPQHTLSQHLWAAAGVTP